MAKSGSGYVGGRLLVASPAMPDPRFQRNVIYMCHHDEKGALGLVVNRPVEDMSEADLYRKVDISPPAGSEDRSIMLGGTVETQQGLVLHSSDYARDATLRIGEVAGLTGSLEILRDLAASKGPARAILTLGHSGWGPGQLDGELRDNGWLVTPGDIDLALDGDHASKWTRALAKVGGNLASDPGLFSSTTGRA